MTKKLADSNIATKSYWTILNRLLHNKKLQTIPPFLINTKKAIIFNNFFAFKCTPIYNANCLPSFSYRTGHRISSFYITENDILAIIKTLYANKAHGCNNISINMIKICSQPLILPLKIIFEQSLKKKKISRNIKKDKCSSCSLKKTKNVSKKLLFF